MLLTKRELECMEWLYTPVYLSLYLLLMTVAAAKPVSMYLLIAVAFQYCVMHSCWALKRMEYIYLGKWELGMGK